MTTPQPKRVLLRTLKVGESLTFDHGRIVVRLEQRVGYSTARVRFELMDDVVVNKPARPEGTCKPAED
jgi:hypothetical protein